MTGARSLNDPGDLMRLPGSDLAHLYGKTLRQLANAENYLVVKLERNQTISPETVERVERLSSRKRTLKRLYYAFHAQQALSIRREETSDWRRVIYRTYREPLEKE